MEFWGFQAMSRVVTVLKGYKGFSGNSFVLKWFQEIMYDK